MKIRNHLHRLCLKVNTTLLMIINYLHNALPGYRAYVLMCSAAIIFIGTKKSLRKKRVELPQDWFGIHQHGRRFIVLEHQWLPWRHVDTLYKYCLKCENFSLLGISFFVYFYYCLCLCLLVCLLYPWPKQMKIISFDWLPGILKLSSCFGKTALLSFLSLL